jgi:hypothetical protein
LNTAIISNDLSTSEHFLMLSSDAALLVLMGLPHCDDYGRVKASPLHWSIKVCPGRFTAAQVRAAIEEILSAKDEKGETILTAYEVDGERFLRYTKWFKFQGFGPKYVLRAHCPHPVLGVIEPNVPGKMIKDFFGKAILAYNDLDEPVREFLNGGAQREIDSGNPSADSGIEDGESGTDTTDTGAKDPDSTSVQNDSGNQGDNSGTDQEQGQNLTPSSFSILHSPSQSSSPSPTQEFQNDDENARKPKRKIGGEGQPGPTPPPPTDPLVCLAVGAIGRIPKFAGTEFDLGALTAGLELVRKVAPSEDAIALQVAQWEAENARGRLANSPARDPVSVLLAWMDRQRIPWQNEIRQRGGKGPAPTPADKPKAGVDYEYRFVDGSDVPIWVFLGTDERFDETEWRRRRGA